VRELVREDDALLVRLDLERADQPVAGARDPVGADVSLRERPEGRLVVAREDAVALPFAEVARRLLLAVRKRQPDDVVRAPREVLVALLRRDHVERRRHEPLQRPRLPLVVAKRAKRLDDRHPGHPSIRLGT
jgi:hypothetical protein